MSRLSIEVPGRAQTVLGGLQRDMERRINASQPGLCPVDMSLNFLRLCHAQTCGKCVPCRVGLNQPQEVQGHVHRAQARLAGVEAPLHIPVQAVEHCLCAAWGLNG